MMKQNDAAAGGQGSRIRLPLNQTVFLPREAMGVRYIDKVRTAVFVEKVSAGEQGLWLRGLYELDLEYQGMEGVGLHKHRVSLPLKLAVPAGWPQGVPLQQVEAGELHTAIKKPIIRLLSPYVLEFCAELQIEYLGDECWQEDKLPPPAPAPRHIWCDDVPMQDDARSDGRLENKIDRFFVGRAAGANLQDATPRMVSSRGKLTDETVPNVSTAGRVPVWPGVHNAKVTEEAPEEAPKEVKHSLPVWKYVPHTAVEKPVESAVEEKGKVLFAKDRVAKDPAKEQIWAPGLNKNRFRSILTAAAIARIKARGENLLAVRQEETAAVGSRATNGLEEKGDEVILAENVAENMVENVVENVAEEVVETAEVTESEVAEAVASEEISDVSVSDVSVDISEKAGEASAEVVSEEVLDVAQNVEVAPDEPGVQLVNSRGVKVRLTARQVAPPRQELAQPASGGFAIRYYVVKPGDDAMHIALRHNISLERLQEANKLPDGELAAGTLLRIPR